MPGIITADSPTPVYGGQTINVHGLVAVAEAVVGVAAGVSIRHVVRIIEHRGPGAAGTVAR